MPPGRDSTSYEARFLDDLSSELPCLSSFIRFSTFRRPLTLNFHAPRRTWDDASDVTAIGNLRNNLTSVFHPLTRAIAYLCDDARKMMPLSRDVTRDAFSAQRRVACLASRRGLCALSLLEILLLLSPQLLPLLVTVCPGDAARENPAGSRGWHRLHDVRPPRGGWPLGDIPLCRQGSDPTKERYVHPGDGLLRHRQQPGHPQAPARRRKWLEETIASTRYLAHSLDLFASFISRDLYYRRFTIIAATWGIPSSDASFCGRALLFEMVSGRRENAPAFDRLVRTRHQC